MAIIVQTFLASVEFIIPEGVTSIFVEAWGKGGNGGMARTSGTYRAAGGGGAGGQYANGQISVIPGETAYIIINTASSYFGVKSNQKYIRAMAGANGGTATMTNTSNNGAGGLGSIIYGVGDIVYKGGNGFDGVFATNGGAGGGGAGSTMNGSNASSGNISGGATYESGGAGGRGSSSTTMNGNLGAGYGGGGGGGLCQGSVTRIGGIGGIGTVIISYTEPIITDNSNFFLFF